MSESEQSSSGSGGLWPRTLWPQVETLVSQVDEVHALAAAEALCERYRAPIINWLKRNGEGHHDAEDLAQEFIHSFFTAARLRNFRRTSVRFRSFLITALRNFLISDLRKRKRDPLRDLVPPPPGEEPPGDLDDSLPPAGAQEADDVLDLDIARAIDRRVLRDLAKTKYNKPEQAIRFEALKHLILDEPAEGEYESLATQLSVETGNLRVILFRLRDAHYDAFRAEVAEISRVEDIDQETRYLLGLLIEYGPE